MPPRAVDALIIGLGAAGGVLAKELATAGMRVVALERGDAIPTSDLHQLDELRMSVRGWLSNNAGQPVTRRLDDSTPARVTWPQASGIGGQTLHWAAVSWRFHADDFRVRSHTLERYGESALPNGTLVEDWPIGYDDLEPYYDQAEYELGISGLTREESGNPHEAPRARGYPLPPLRESQASRTFRDAARSIGCHPFPAPAAILSEDYIGPLGIPRRGCQYCGFCRNHACIVDAKASSAVTLVPAALQTGNLEIRTSSTAVRINVDSGGRATSVSYYDATGALQEQHAALVFVAAGGVAETIRLLFLSGIGDSNGRLGKGWMGHMRPSLIAAFDERVMNAFMGPNHAKWCVDDFNADNFDHTGLGFIGGGLIFSDVNGSGGPLSFYDNLPDGVPRWGSAYKAHLARYFARHISIGAWVENLPNQHSYVDLDPHVVDRWGLPAARITSCRQPNDDARLTFIRERIKVIADATACSKRWWTLWDAQTDAHEAGGARMGNDPASSVTNAWGQVWDTPNVFVASSALFPTMSGLNTTLTIFALAYRQAAYVKAEARAGGAIASYV